MDYTPRSDEVGLYFRHERPGQLIAGLHTEEAGEALVDPDRYARSADPDFLEAVARRLSSRLPGLADSRLAHGWAGVYPVSPDGLPQVGPAGVDPTIITAGGAGGSGIQLSPAIGELVADWIELGEPGAIAGARALVPARASLQAAAGD
jgi:sarcosine oxidase subunit beta